MLEGCTDGTFHSTGQKFFNCPIGKGLYYPLGKLKPDARYAPEVAVDGNREINFWCIFIFEFVMYIRYIALKHVSGEEPEVCVTCSIDQYIGDAKGIQGHQNSCYMDATLFGLFALTTEFDNMFLPKSDSPSMTSSIGSILWKNIVNPLRK